MSMKFNEILIGTKAELSHKVTVRDIEKFVDLSGDDNKLHVDKAFAAKTPFKKPVVHGMIGVSFISAIIGTKLPGDGALWYAQSLEFLLPVRIGDTLDILAEVIKKNENERTVDLKVEILNQNRQVVTRGISKVKVLEVAEQQEIQQEEMREKVVLVIGATGGIGTAVALKLAKDGFNIILHCHSNYAKAEQIVKQIEQLGRKAFIVTGDIYSEKSLDDMVEKSIRKFDSIDVLVNCAAISIPNIKYEDLRWDDMDRQLIFNIKINLDLAHRVTPYMLAQKWGRIITIGSIVTDRPTHAWMHYSTAKAALEGLTKSMALELAPHGIHVNMVSPSLVETELTADIPAKMKLISASQTPLRRLATPEDIAGAVSFLAGENASFLAGEVIRINGGQVMI